MRLQSSLLSHMQLPLRQRIFPLGFPVTVVTNSEAVLAAAADSFGHRDQAYGETGLEVRIGVTDSASRAAPALPVRRQFGHLYTMVADPENQSVLDLQTGANFTWLASNAVRHSMYLRRNFLEKVVYLLLGAHHVTDLHAGCVSRGGKGVLLCGSSGAGKSSLSYACARAGWTYTSDDTCYLLRGDHAPRVAGHAHRVRFRPEARQLFPELAAHAATEQMEGKPSIELPLSALPVQNSAPECDVSAIVYLKRQRVAQHTLRPLQQGSGARRLAAELFSAGTIRAEHEQHLEILATVPSFELFYETLEDGIAGLESLLARL